MKINVLKEYAKLQSMTPRELAVEWKKYFDYAPQAYSNKIYLVNNIIYRIQEIAYGGLARETIDRLEAVADAEQNIVTDNKTRFAIGTKLVREVKGVEHHVTVISDGYEYQGMKYKSLSGIAFAITGTRWNGNTFFGLGRNENAKSHHKNLKKEYEKNNFKRVRR